MQCVDILDGQINSAVYELYGLSEAEKSSFNVIDVISFH